jgi:hypothetical protein
MATFARLASGNWRVQVRRKGRYASDTFLRRRDGEEWALEVERAIDRGVAITSKRPKGTSTFADLIDLHTADLVEVGKPIRHSKSALLEALKCSLGYVRIKDLSREKLVEFGRRRAKQGAGPVTLSVDFSYIGTILKHAAAVHGIAVPTENVRLARAALTHLGLIGRGTSVIVDRRRTRSTSWSRISKAIRVS